MALAEVLLKKPVAGLGAEGDLVKVRAGFARNFLFPQGIAVPMTLANRKQIEALKKARAAREAKELDDAKAAAEKLSGVALTFAVKTGDAGKLFGSISTTDIAKKLAGMGHDIEKKAIHLENGAIKQLGKTTASVKFHAEVSVEIAIEVVSENPVEEVAEDASKGKKGRKPRAPKAEEAAEAPKAE